MFGSIFSFLFVGPLRKYKNVEANYIAEEMINQIVDKLDSDYLFEVHDSSEISRVIEMAWEDRTPFDAIKDVSWS